MKTKLSKTVVVFVVLLLVFILISLFVNYFLLNFEIPFIGAVGNNWSNSSDFTSATLGIAIAVSGAFVAILIAQRTADVADRADIREIYLLVDNLIEQDAERLKNVKNSIENITSYSLIIANLIEKSQVFKSSKNSLEMVSIDNNQELSSSNAKFVNSDDNSVVSMGTEHFLINTEEGKLLSGKLHCILTDLINNIFSLSNNIFKLSDSEAIRKHWFENFQDFIKLQKEKSNESLLCSIEDIHFILCRENIDLRERSFTEIEFEKFIRNMTFELKFNAQKLKSSIVGGDINTKEILIPMLEIAHKVYDYKLKMYTGKGYNSNLKLELDSLDLLIVNSILCSDFDVHVFKNKGFGNICTALLYIINVPSESKKEKRFINLITEYTKEWKGFPDENKIFLEKKYKNDFCSTVKYTYDLSLVTLQTIIKQWSASFFYFESSFQGIDDILIQDSRFNTANSLEQDIFDHLEIFFENNSIVIRNSSLTFDVWMQSDVMEPLLILWINKESEDDYLFKKQEESLLYFVNNGSKKYHYVESDIDKIEKFCSFIYDKYYDKTKKQLDLTDLVKASRNHVVLHTENENIILSKLLVSIGFPRDSCEQQHGQVQVIESVPDKLVQLLKSKISRFNNQKEDIKNENCTIKYIEQYVIQENDNEDLLFVFYQRNTPKTILRYCNYLYHLERTELHLELSGRDVASIMLVFSGLSADSIKKIDKSSQIMIMELGESTNDKPFHYVITKRIS